MMPLACGWVRQGGRGGEDTAGAARGPRPAACRLGIRLPARRPDEEAVIRWKVGGWLPPSGSTMFLNTEEVFGDTHTHRCASRLPLGWEPGCGA